MKKKFILPATLAVVACLSLCAFKFVSRTEAKAGAASETTTEMSAGDYSPGLQKILELIQDTQYINQLRDGKNPVIDALVEKRINEILDWIDDDATNNDIFQLSSALCSLFPAHEAEYVHGQFHMETEDGYLQFVYRFLGYIFAHPEIW